MSMSYGMKPVEVVLQQRGQKAVRTPVSSLDGASGAVTRWQDARGLGASDCGREHGNVYVDGVLTHRISYNGRIWPVTV
jgi:hypothetical protein